MSHAEIYVNCAGDLSAETSRQQLIKRLSNQPTAVLAQKIPQLEIPWAIHGWFDAVEVWIKKELKSQGLMAIAPMEVVKNWALAIILRIPTTGGMIYFKASSPLFTQEAALTGILAAKSPHHLPEVLAINPEKSWLLMRELKGKILASQEDIFYWEAALHEWAKFQISAIENRADFLASGWEDLGIENLSKTLDKLLSSSINSSWNHGQKLPSPEFWQLLPFVPKLQQVLKQLRELNIPDTLVHGDLSPCNIYICHQGFVYFDWSDTCIAHPFFDLIRFLYDIAQDLPHVAEARSLIRHAYLTPWTIYAPMDKLVATFEFAAATLGSIYETISAGILGGNLDKLWGYWGKYWPSPTNSQASKADFYLQRLLIQLATYLHFAIVKQSG